MGKILVSDLYNIDSFKKAVDSAKTFDGEMGILLPRSLEAIVPRLHEQVGIDETFLSLGIQVDNSGGYVDYITSLKLGANGDFEKIGNKSQTTGKISLSGEKTSIAVDWYEAESSFTELELQKASNQNINLLGQLVTAHNRKYNSKIDTLGYIGDSKAKKQGIINYKDWDESASAKPWRNMTNDELTTELRNLVINQRSGKNTKWYCDTIVVTPELYNRVAMSDYKDQSELTIKSKFERDLGVTFAMTYYAKRKSDEVAIALCTNQDAIAMRIPKRLEISPVHQKGFRYYFEGAFGIGGVDVLEDVSFRLTGL